jgi:hypothetical protein
MTDIREDLKAYLDGELPPERAIEMEQALAESAELRKEAALFTAISAQIRRQARAAAAVEAPAGVLRAPGPLWRRPAVWVPAMGLAAVAALAVFVAPRLAGRLGSDALAPASEAAAQAGSAIMGEAVTEDPPVLDRLRDKSADVFPAETQSRTEPAPNASDSRAQVLIEPDRRIIRTGSITLEVEKLLPMVSVIEGLAAGAGGYVESSSQSAGEDVKTANLTIRVRSNSFTGVMDQLRQLGRVTSESSSGQDVTLQISDLQARVRALRAEEESLLQILRTTRRTSEVLEVRDRLSRVRMEIESMDSQRAALSGLAAMSTISISLQEKEQIDSAAPGDAVNGAWTAALNALNAAFQGLVVVLIWLLVFAPIWLPLALIGWRLSRRREKRD